MPITAAQVAAAEAVQHAAAHDAGDHVRLVAGPGTGKSATIQERVCWLIMQGAPADSIFAISFTRASSHDLRNGIHRNATRPGYETIGQVSVTTLHSLALRVLRAAQQLNAYPVEPLVLDDWELENIFDAEFGYLHTFAKRRREDIRRDHEAFWSTGAWGPPNYIPADPPITAAERTIFDGFHGPRTQTYACVLPGEIVRLCVDRMDTGLLDAVALLGIRHLIVDEFQDLNPYDLRFVRHLATQGAKIFVAGDDDQSVYSFRHASPAGIQNFPTDYPVCAAHQLTDCFRCSITVLAASMALMAAHPGVNRIPKAHVSLYTASTPPVPGNVHRWRFNSSQAEAKAIAQSCADLIAGGILHREILILLSNQRALARPLIDELEALGIPAEHPREEGFPDTDTGRLVLAILRIVCNPNDYVALRTLLRQRTGVAIGRCCTVSDAVIANSLNWRDIFYNPLPTGVFNGQALAALNPARTTCAALTGWQATNTIQQRTAEIDQLVQNHYNAVEVTEWQTFTANLPPDMTLDELREFMSAPNDEQQNTVMTSVFQRLGIPVPMAGALPPRVRIMTMHGAKGLSAQVVFIPGLEEEIFPGPWKSPYPGLVLEAARLLYVSVTRARAACVVSYSTRRMVNGTSQVQTPSRFAANLAGAFGARTNSLTPAEVTDIITHCNNLF